MHAASAGKGSSAYTAGSPDEASCIFIYRHVYDIPRGKYSFIIFRLYRDSEFLLSSDGNLNLEI